MSTDLWGVLRSDGERGSVRFERPYDTTAADLWRIVTEPERLGRWFAPVSGDLRIGGVYHADMGTDGISSGRIRECDPPHRYLVSWEDGGEQESEVEVTVTAAGEQAVLALEHRGLPARFLPDYGAGWQGYLEVLEATSEGPAEWSTDRYRALLPHYEALARKT